MPVQSINPFTDDQALATALAQRIADDLRNAIRERGQAVIAVSGGSTPKRLFEKLSLEELNWGRVTITLVDERWVPDTDERSNAKLVKELLLRNLATAAEFVPLYIDEPTPEAAIGDVRARIAALKIPFDVVVLGMGPDGHTASFFPGGDRLAEALDTGNKAEVIPMRAEGAGEPRITLTLPVLCAARALYLHIEGRDKRAVLEQAEHSDSQLPISSILRNAPQLKIYWCP